MAKKVDEFLKYYKVSVHPDRVCVTPSFEHARVSRKAIGESDDIDYSGIVPGPRKVVFNVDNKLSRISKSKINRAVTYLNYISKPKVATNFSNGNSYSYSLTFVTLTLASVQVHSDNEIKRKLINQFFVEAKQRWGVSHYVWRGEKQGNGNLHIHILCDKFIPYDQLRDVWNRVQNKLGYVDRYSERMRSLTYNEYVSLYKYRKDYSVDKIKKAWIKGRATNWAYPNSTDIHSLHFVNDITAYICKYMKKDEQNQGLEGRMWSCSHSLSNLQGGRDIVDSSLSDEINTVATAKGVRHIGEDYYDIFFTTPADLLKLQAYILHGLLQQFLSERFESPPKC